MIAKIEVPASYDIAKIALLAGVSDTENLLYRDGWLFVVGVAQSGLDSALATYDHAEIEEARGIKNEERDIIKNLLSVVISLIDKCEASQSVDFILEDIPVEIRPQVIKAVQRRRG